MRTSVTISLVSFLKREKELQYPKHNINLLTHLLVKFLFVL